MHETFSEAAGARLLDQLGHRLVPDALLDLRRDASVGDDLGIMLGGAFPRRRLRRLATNSAKRASTGLAGSVTKGSERRIERLDGVDGVTVRRNHVGPVHHQIAGWVELGDHANRRVVAARHAGADQIDVVEERAAERAPS
jgi:hypothetical protein